jgi:hypothetical protein
MEAISSSEASVLTTATQSNIPEDGIIQDIFESEITNFLIITSNQTRLW